MTCLDVEVAAKPAKRFIFNVQGEQLNAGLRISLLEKSKHSHKRLLRLQLRFPLLINLFITFHNY